MKCTDLSAYFLSFEKCIHPYNLNTYREHYHHLSSLMFLPSQAISPSLRDFLFPLRISSPVLTQVVFHSLRFSLRISSSRKPSWLSIDLDISPLGSHSPTFGFTEFITSKKLFWHLLQLYCQ